MRFRFHLPAEFEIPDAWWSEAGVTSITAVQPLHVASWIELQTQALSAPTVK